MVWAAAGGQCFQPGDFLRLNIRDDRFQNHWNAIKEFIGHDPSNGGFSYFAQSKAVMDIDQGYHSWF
ncbi:hypothetical protein BG74_09200 [Sodalis-like endosymbiont of Proechinophthirus fluctus]|nr:hypothetical protein BG74_09200 [Sodalis-like endosymbiont of Proechinophthirus fluctus]